MLREKAGLKANGLKQAFVRMLAGEIFYHNGKKMQFNTFDSSVPFLGGDDPLLLSDMADLELWEVEVDWKANLEECPRLCRVYNTETRSKHIAIVIDYEKSSPRAFLTDHGSFKYAELIADPGSIAILLGVHQ